MSTYTVEDFAQAKFAQGPKTLACRDRDTGRWYSTSGAVYTDMGMASGPWIPLHIEETLSLATLREAWETAEVITEDNLPRVGDTIIGAFKEDANEFTVYATDFTWTTPIGNSKRILKRAPRCEGAGRLEDLLRAAGTGGIADPAELADWLVERGVEVEVDDDDDD